ncbi:Uncharacterized protein TCM_025179 isoform 3 [Theobroma cacao]|uniref:Uncharacterized protein isoform 3 n=1 Tax=Theobroma cacao TaxID=3641 RepID=A0A061EXK3_THECC|nr:Uncharacterized protein TCM_025179 isoform 3 [Theobroma cacao]EOY09806.1 Uncharacterized protein TCM_025179 isoform 3 [Theobroma cacao]
MAGIGYPNLIPRVNRTTTQSPLNLQRAHGARCCSVAPENEKKTKTPQILRLAVSGVTELLRLFSSSTKDRVDDGLCTREREGISVSDVDEVLRILKSDYENAYFVTGKELYSRNLKLLVPFFDNPSIGLQKIEKGVKVETNFVLATWRLRTFLKLPWKPLISIDGSTFYELGQKFTIVRHAESWNVSALEAVGQIFTPSFWKAK